MTNPWHANREEVFALMRQIDEAVHHAWSRARDLGPRGGSVSVGSADFDYTLKATVGEQYLRVLRNGGDPASAFTSAIEAGKESIAKWNTTGCMSRAVINSRYELLRDNCAADAIALGFHARFAAFAETKPQPPIPESKPVIQSRVRFGPPVIDGSGYCGPVCLSALTGIGTKQIASVLRAEFSIRAVRGVTLEQMAWFIKAAGYQLALRRPKCSTIEEMAQVCDGVFLVGLKNHWMLLNSHLIVCTEFRGVGAVANSKYRQAHIEMTFEIQGELSKTAFNALALPREKRRAAKSQLALF